MKHTPTPWTVYYAKITHNPPILGIGDSEGVGITDAKGMMWGDPDEAKANAEFIVRAVNCHDKLLAAAKLALGVLIEISNVASKAGIPKLKEFEALEKIIKEAEES